MPCAWRSRLWDDGDPGKALREIATACIEKAKAGDLQAAAFVRDTMDGKPTQMLEHTGEEGRRIGKIVHEIVHVTEEIVDVTDTREMIDNEIDGKNLIVDHRETEAINGHGSNGHGGGRVGDRAKGAGSRADEGARAGLYRPASRYGARPRVISPPPIAQHPRKTDSQLS
jgi:hypothetical protein